MDTNQIPVIDVSQLLEDDAALDTLDHACRDWGFFQVVGHGLTPELIRSVYGEMHNFFGQPSEEKQKIERTAENAWGFYDKELTKNTRDMKEIFDVGPAETEGPLAGSIPQWPENVPEFKNTMEGFYTGCTRVAHRIVSAIAVNLGMPADHLRECFTTGHTSFLRLNYYPVCDDPAPSDTATVPQQGQMGVNRHTDAGAVTVLLQDDQPGLQVHRDGNWYTIPPIEGALVINIGDIVQVWSNNQYQAALHRVLASSGKERYSAPFFFNPTYVSNYAPLPSVVSNEEPAQYRSINWGEFRAGRAAGDYSDDGEEIQISHFAI